MNLPPNEFPIAAQGAYLNTAAQGPLPARTVAAINSAAQRAQFLEPDRARGEPDVFDETRTRLARLLGVSASDFVFGPNTTYGLNICTHGIDWREGDNIVVPRDEFPSVQYALVGLPSRGVEVRTVNWSGAGASVADIMGAVDSRTRAVICSAITWDMGYRADLATLGARCAAAGCLLIVDGIHAVGAEQLDLKALRVSAMSFHSYKWLLAGFGNGVLYVAPDAANQIRPTYVGPQGVDGDLMRVQNPIQWKAGALRYSSGTGNALGSHALNASLTLIEELGVRDIAAHNHALAGAIHQGVKRVLPNTLMRRSDDPLHQSAIVVFSTGAESSDRALVEFLAERKIIVALRPLGIRIAPHLFNTHAHVEQFLSALRDFAKS